MKYYNKIDGLRFIAVFLVLVEHFITLIAKYISAGYYGVDLFFVISGFLITSILLKSCKGPVGANYKNFVARRTLRIFPLYYLTILVLWTLSMAEVRENIWWLVTYTFNYKYIKLTAGPISHFWSLCIEEQFYLFWPIVVLLLRNRLNVLMGIIIAMIAFGYSQMMFKFIDTLTPYNYVGLPTRMASLAIGACGSVLVYRKQIPEWLLKSRGVEILILLLLVLSLTLSFVGKPLALGICSLYLVLKSAGHQFELNILNKFLSNKSIIYLGSISYGIYILHVPVAYYTGTYIFDPFWNSINFSNLGPVFEKLKWHSWIFKFPLYSFLSIVLAAISFKYFESPILKLKDRFFSYEKENNMLKPMTVEN